MLKLSPEQKRIVLSLSTGHFQILFRFGTYYLEDISEGTNRKISSATFARLEDRGLLKCKQKTKHYYLYTLSEAGEKLFEAKSAVKSETPYLHRMISLPVLAHNPEYGNNRVCRCGDTYKEHFLPDGIANTKKCPHFVEFR